MNFHVSHLWDAQSCKEKHETDFRIHVDYGVACLICDDWFKSKAVKLMKYRIPLNLFIRNFECPAIRQKKNNRKWLCTRWKIESNHDVHVLNEKEGEKNIIYRWNMCNNYTQNSYHRFYFENHMQHISYVTHTQFTLHPLCTYYDCSFPQICWCLPKFCFSLSQ